jgi:hypothetical protein
MMQGFQTKTDTFSTRFIQQSGELKEKSIMRHHLNEDVLASGDFDSFALAGATASGNILMSDSDGNGTWQSSQVFITKYVKLADEKTSGINGGTFTSGSWQLRDIAEITDTENICSVVGNIITLAAGTYICDISCPAYSCDAHQAKLYNYTLGSDIIYGTSEYANSNTGRDASRSIIKGQFVLSGTTELKILHKCSATEATNGFGVASGFDLEVYSIAEFFKIA